MKDFEKAHFVVVGEVNSPGRFELRGNVTVFEAIAIAGGFKTASAKHSQVLLVHRVNDQFGETHVLNLKEIAKTQSFSEDRTIQPRRHGRHTTEHNQQNRAICEVGKCRRVRESYASVAP